MPGVSNLFTEEDVAGLLLYNEVFYPSTLPPEFVHFIHKYILALVAPYLDASPWEEFSVAPEVREPVGVFEFKLWDKYSLDHRTVATAKVDTEKLEVLDLTLSVPPDVLKRVVERVGSASLGAAMAILEVLSNSRECKESFECSMFIRNVEKAVRWFSELGVVVAPDPEVYEYVKELLEKWGIPFHTQVEIDSKEWKTLRELYSRLSEAAREEYKSVGRLNEALSVGTGSVWTDAGRLTLELGPATPAPNASIGITSIGVRVGNCFDALGL